MKTAPTSSAVIEVTWQIGHTEATGGEPAAWYPASVPGAAQLDVGRAEQLPDYQVGDQVRAWAWLEERRFVYRAEFGRPALATGERVFFYSAGIDYEACVRLNGRELARHVGPYSPVEVDLTEHLTAVNELRVELAPVPKRADRPADRSQASAVFRPAVSYGWDFQPRLPSVGIWAETCIERRPAGRIDEAEIGYRLTDALDAAELSARWRGAGLAGKKLRFTLTDPQGGVVLARELVAAADEQQVPLGRMENVALWWPRQHGAPALYRWEVALAGAAGQVGGARRGGLGFRRVRLLMNEGAWDDPLGFPSSRNAAAMQFEVNGRRIFVKGSNWVPPEIFPGSITAARYAELIDLAARAHFDLLRVWGGGGPAHEAFYRACDEAGLLVWQEFPLACNAYPDEADYLAVLDAEARAIVRRLRGHACLALWSGGNELFNRWSGMTDQSLALRKLNAICLDLDPLTPFVPTSPLEGAGHGYYRFVEPTKNEEVFQLMARMHKTAYPEFGVPGPSPVELLRAIIPAAELWPPRPGTAWETHHGFNSWTAETWLDLPMIERYFGAPATLEEMVARGQLLQAEGLKGIFEEARRQKPYCSMALNWAFNDPWPCAANGSLIAYPNRAKPAYAAVAGACRPVLASARIERLAWAPGESFSAELWVLNDRTDPAQAAIAPGRLRAWIECGGERAELLAWDFPAVAANTNLRGPVARLGLPAWARGVFYLKLEIEGRPEWSSTYALVVRTSASGGNAGSTPGLNQ